MLAELLRLVEDEMLHDALLRSTEADDQARAEARNSETVRLEFI